MFRVEQFSIESIVATSRKSSRASDRPSNNSKRGLYSNSQTKVKGSCSGSQVKFAEKKTDRYISRYKKQIETKIN